jgi:hypothetical protein
MTEMEHKGFPVLCTLWSNFSPRITGQGKKQLPREKLTSHLISDALLLLKKVLLCPTPYSALGGFYCI